ncbi:inositol oxygenase family protein [Rhodopirellula sp. MGV]|uniref:inositol oxygenase family protein n=1 Tax=Rhodopirellula sp. MGV TaxID=2023130 RepID=UPI000B972105|nr:inositol oxygenase family protein [Rhodopirellula sp. MGV]OYP37737.1 inositol oxygenase [Rhodopirellula sp. MGV]PNY37175.1 inositol oxygenase [Rhodopirellula baltica]
MKTEGPLETLDDWEDDLAARYPAGGKATEEFRDYSEQTRPGVREFYRQNHRFQTYDFVTQKRKEFLGLNRRKMTVWQAMEFLNQLVDESDPDTDLSQIEHLMQTAEGIRADGHPRWMILTGLIHDLGKILCLFNEPQWAVVGDTFPVGCQFSDRIVLSEFFADNPDSNDPRYNTKYGVYEPNVGLDRVLLSWGHDEYLYHVVKDYLPEEALYMIRYHSFYPQHRESAYDHLLSNHDQRMFRWVNKFNPYDLYTKSDQRPDVNALKPYYMELINEFLPGELNW